MGRKPESKSSRRRILAREREARALELRKAGYTYAQIAAALGYRSIDGAYKAVMRAIEKLVPVEDAEEVRKLELEKLDKLEKALWPQVENGDCAAVDRMLRVMERRARYLGLDAPQKVAPTDPSGKKPLRLVDLFPPGLLDPGQDSGELPSEEPAE